MSAVCGKRDQRSMHSTHEHARMNPIVKAFAVPLVAAYAGCMLGMTAADGHPEVALVIIAGYVALLVTGIKVRISARALGPGSGLQGIYGRGISMLVGFIFLFSAMTAAGAALTGKLSIDALIAVGVATGAATAAMIVAGHRDEG